MEYNKKIADNIYRIENDSFSSRQPAAYRNIDLLARQVSSLYTNHERINYIDYCIEIQKYNDYEQQFNSNKIKIIQDKYLTDKPFYLCFAEMTKAEQAFCLSMINGVWYICSALTKVTPPITIQNKLSKCIISAGLNGEKSLRQAITYCLKFIRKSTIKEIPVSKQESKKFKQKYFKGKPFSYITCPFMDGNICKIMSKDSCIFPMIAYDYSLIEHLNYINGRIIPTILLNVTYDREEGMKLFGGDSPYVYRLKTENMKQDVISGILLKGVHEGNYTGSFSRYSQLFNWFEVPNGRNPLIHQQSGGLLWCYPENACNDLFERENR
jgi:hypothetical protein